MNRKLLWISICLCSAVAGYVVGSVEKENYYKSHLFSKIDEESALQQGFSLSINLQIHEEIMNESLSREELIELMSKIIPLQAKRFKEKLLSINNPDMVRKGMATVLEAENRFSDKPYNK